jgi:hypothetical protein
MKNALMLFREKGFMQSGLDDAPREVDDTALDRRGNPMSGEAVISFVRDLVPAVIELFVIVDPLGNLPIFVALTARA